MAIPTVDYGAGLWGIYIAVGQTLGRLKAYQSKYPEFKPHVEAFTTLRAECWSLLGTEADLNQELHEAHGAVKRVDGDMDPTVRNFNKSVLAEVDGDRDSALNRYYFANKTATEICRPVLGQEVEFVEAWIPKLKEESRPALAAFAAPVEQYVAEAKAASAKREQVKQARHDYRVFGPRYKFVQALNAQRKATYGFLSELPHKPGFEHLPVTFGDFFFEHSTRQNSEPTLEDVKQNVEQLQLELQDRQALLQRMLEAQAAEEVQKERNAELAAELAEAERTAAEAEKKIAAIRARLRKK